MPIVIFLVLLTLPLAEIAVFVEVGGEIGVWPTIALVVVGGVLGLALMRVQGFSTLRRAQEAMQRGEAPLVEMVEGAMLFVAAVLVVMPGFITDIAGLLLLVPPLRRMAAAAVARRMAERGHVHVRTGGRPAGPGGPVIDGEAHEIEDDAPDDTETGRGPRRLPPEDPSSPWRREP